MVETLKASGHEVSLVINAGSSSSKRNSTTEEILNGSGGGASKSQELPSPDTPYESRLLADQSTGNSQSTYNSDGLSSSQDTLDDIVDSPASFEGDTDFGGMEKVLMKSQVLDLHRTSSAPLTHRERTVALEASTESGPPSGSRGGGGRDQGKRETGSLDDIDGVSVESGGSATTSVDSLSYEARLQMRTYSSDGIVDSKKVSTILALFPGLFSRL